MKHLTLFLTIIMLASCGTEFETKHGSLKFYTYRKKQGKLEDSERQIFIESNNSLNWHYLFLTPQFVNCILIKEGSISPVITIPIPK